MARASMSVVVGVDFDRTSDDAISTGLALLSGGAARELHVVQVLAARREAESGARPWSVGERQLLECASIALALRVRACAREAKQPSELAGVVLQTMVGSAVESLLLATRACSADLLIMGAEARCCAGRARGGSVVAELVERGTCPVLIAPRYLCCATVRASAWS